MPDDAPFPTRFRSFGLSDVGRKRSNNEDRWAANDHTLLVCDGIGGRPGGAEAAELAVVTFMETIGGKPPDAYLLDYAATRADREVRELGRDTDLAGMGSTLAGAVLGSEGVLWTISLGDSRVYRVRDGEPLRQLSIDHTLAEEAARRGDPPIGDHYGSVITRAVGAGQSRVKPEVFRHDVRFGDRLLVCSDGLTNEVSDEEICSILIVRQIPRRRVATWSPRRWPVVGGTMSRSWSPMPCKCSDQNVTHPWIFCTDRLFAQRSVRCLAPAVPPPHRPERNLPVVVPRRRWRLHFPVCDGHRVPPDRRQRTSPNGD